MPIYEYACPECGHEFEEWGKASESHKEEPCPLCGVNSPRVMSRTSFVLKGDGWYVSDYGYRKGITEDGKTREKVPAKSDSLTPAKQTDKTIAKAETPKKEKKATENAQAAKTAGASCKEKSKKP